MATDKPRIQVYLEPDTYAALEAMAEEDDRSLSYVVAWIIEQHLKGKS